MLISKMLKITIVSKIIFHFEAQTQSQEYLFRILEDI